MSPLKKATLMASSKEILYEALIEYIEKGKLQEILNNPDKDSRMTTR